MADKPVVERIDPDLEVLMDRFFVNSKDDVQAMLSALETGDFATLTRLGHTAKGTGYGYGFRGMGDLGLAIENAAKGSDAELCRAEISRLAEYLNTVQVEYGE